MKNESRTLYPRLIIAAPASGSGKTTFSLGLMAAFCRRGLAVQAYKVGPDYIDPAFHSAITGRSSINLDGWMLDEAYMKKMFLSYSRDADLSIVEGVMGLYDGYGDEPLLGSTAGMARMLHAPVILIMSAHGMAASAAAAVYGMQEFGEIKIAGVVINKPSSPNHYRIVKEAIERHTGVKVAGFLPKTPGIELKSRHLGLIQSCEIENFSLITRRLADLVEENVDLDYLIQTAGGAAKMEAASFLPREEKREDRVNIGVAWDQAFSFYYYENLALLERLGANLRFFSPLNDDRLPDGCSGLYLGGGYPEVFARELATNREIKAEIGQAAEAGMPVFAECGGYMYLNRSFTSPEGKVYEFAGIFDGEAEMTETLQNFGYVALTGLKDTILFGKGQRSRAHEFHRSVIKRKDQGYCVTVQKRKNGETIAWQCGRSYKNVFGMYPHVYFPSNMAFARRFIDRCRDYYHR